MSAIKGVDCIKWKEEAHPLSASPQKRPPNSSMMQRLQIAVGLSRCLYGVNTLLLSKKETSAHSQNVNCATFMGSASTTKSTTVSAAEKQDLTKVKQQEIQNWICCPEILNVAVSPFLTCNKDCKKKITSPPGSKIESASIVTAPR